MNIILYIYLSNFKLINEESSKLRTAAALGFKPLNLHTPIIEHISFCWERLHNYRHEQCPRKWRGSVMNIKFVPKPSHLSGNFYAHAGLIEKGGYCAVFILKSALVQTLLRRTPGMFANRRYHCDQNANCSARSEVNAIIVRRLS